MARGSFVAILVLLAFSSSAAQHPYTQKQVIAYAKSIDVHTLDPSLPSQHLEEWLQAGPPHTHILYWIVADTCDLKPTDRNVVYPLCAKVSFGRDGEYGEFLVQVGNSREGIVGTPKLYYGVGVYERVYVVTGSSERLSDLPSLLNQPAVAGGVQKLYSEIVARHPIGIPVGPEMAGIRPYLSKRLAEQLQTAQACQDDYGRQHRPNAASKPNWMKSGLFSGEGSHALPIDVVADRKVKLNDGSFLVYVDLEPKDAIIHLEHGRRGAFHRGSTWQVEARVVSEEGEFVVDDVRIFDHFPAEGPSRLLSESFTGCSGTHWAGTAAVQ